MELETFSEKEYWKNEIIDHSELLIDFFTVGLPERDTRTQSWKGYPLSSEIVRFIAGDQTQIQGVIRLWKKAPYILLHISGVVHQPIKMEARLNVNVPFNHPSLIPDNHHGWIPTDKTPIWISSLLKNLHSRIDLASSKKIEYQSTLTTYYEQSKDDDAVGTKYLSLREEINLKLSELKKSLNKIQPKTRGELDLTVLLISTFQKNPIRTILTNPDLKSYFSGTEKDQYLKLKNLFKQFWELARNDEIALDKFTYDLPTTYQELGGPKARVLGLLPNKVTELAKQVEWSALAKEPFFWFAPSAAPLHDLLTIDWVPIINQEEFTSKLILENVTGFPPMEIPPGTSSAYFKDFYAEEEHEELYTSKPNNFYALLYDLYGPDICLDTISPIPYKTIKHTDISLHEWLRAYSDDLSTSLKEHSLILDAQFITDIPDVPFTSALFDRGKGSQLLDLCWEFIAEKYHTQVIQSLQVKYAQSLEKPLDYLLNRAPKDFQMLQEQVSQLVSKLIELEQRLQQSTSTILDMAGGWVPTWVDKDAYILKQVLKNAPHYELSRDELLTQWQQWLKDRGMKRTDRELGYNLRGLRRANVLEKYGILVRQGSTSGAGAKPLLYYLSSKGKEVIE